MKILIEIDEEAYKYLKNGYFISTSERTGKTLLQKFLTAIINGTPLPKGHGDLKDQNEILTVLIKSAEAHCQNSREDALMGRVRQQILGCHAIIEADKESEE